MSALVTQAQQEQALLYAIKQNVYPSQLWKYRPNNKFTDDVFVSQVLYFPTPPQLNDPFDCQIQPVVATPTEIAVWVQQHNPGASVQQLQNVIAHATSNPNAFRKDINEVMRKHIDKLGVCSFTTNPDHPLMWAHYTESHKGLCLGFDVTQDPGLFLVPLRVNYSPTYPLYNHLTQSKQMAEFVLSAKSNHWAYEDEWRVMKHQMPANQKYTFKPQALREVIFGYNMDTKERKRLKLLARQYGFKHVTFKRAIITETSYAIGFVPA